MSRLPLTFPFQGLNKNGTLSQQPPETSRDLVNCVPVDWTTGRLRGSIRSGSSQYFAGYMAGIGHKVQALHSFPYQARHVSYSADPIPNELWAVSLADASTVSVIESGLYDDFFAIQNGTRLVHYSRYGIELGAIDIPGIPIGSSGPILVVGKIHVSEDGAIYVATSDWVTDLSGIGGRHIWKFQLAPDNRALELVWSIVPGNGNLIQGMHVAGDSLWTLETFYTSTTIAEVHLVEYANVNTATGPVSGDRTDHKTITAGDLNALDGNYPAGGPSVFGHDMAMRTVNETSWIIAVGTVHGATAGVWAQLKIKSDYTISANYLFVNNEVAVSAVRGGGVGFAVAVDVTGNVYSMGRRATGDPSSGSWVRMLSDTTTAWLKVWERANATDLGAAATNPGYSYPSIALDYSSNLVVPTCVSSTSVAAAKIIKPSGVLYSSIVQYVYVAGVPTITANETRAVAVPTTHPDYQPDDYPVTDTVFIAGTAVATLTSETTGGSIWGYDTLLETPLQSSSRAICRLGVANGAIYRFTTTGTSVPTNSTGRSPVLSAVSRFVQAADFDGEVFWTDGQDYAVYRPLPGDATNPNGEIVEWRATSLGIIPPRARLICRWRNRIVLAHTADSPWSWHMSAYNDPYDWDLFPPEPLETQAVSGQALPAAGDSPDLIHALVPWSDDLLFIGCSRSILRVDGDPMAGGRISVVSDKIGMAFGSPWCKDPEGRIYFFGSSGGVYVMSPTGELQWLTRDTIEDEISDIDMTTYRLELTWNSRDNGLHVWVIPYETGGVQVRHYFWSQRTGGWFPMEFGTTAVTEMQPTAVHVIDGDTAAERVMIFGTEDGRVLKWDPTASGDDGQPIDARVLMGPLAGPEGDYETRFKRPSVLLARELGGTHVKFFSSPTAETPEMPRDQIRVGPGRNLRLPIQARGAYLWMQIRSATRTTTGIPALGERFAIESITVDAVPAGRFHGQ